MEFVTKNCLNTAVGTEQIKLICEKKTEQPCDLTKIDLCKLQDKQDKPTQR